MPVLSQYLATFIKNKQKTACLACHSMACGNLRGVYHKEHCKDNDKLTNEKDSGE